LLTELLSTILHAISRIQPSRKTGDESFRSGNGSAGFTLLNFWQWTASDLVSNSTRGVLAEFLVARALGVETGGHRWRWARNRAGAPEG